MEVMGNPTNDYFDFNLPYLSAPSTPKRFGEIFMSAPTSPSTLSEFYSQFDYFSIPSPTSEAHHHGFTFFVEDSNNSLSSADEIFYGGKIKHLKEDNNLLAYTNNPLVSPKHHSISTTIIEQGHEDLSPIKKNESYKINNIKVTRGRNKTPSFASSNSCRERVSPSLSPFREFQYTFAEESKQVSSNKENVTKSSTSPTPLKSSRKWRLRDLLSFRGISEGNSISSNKDSLMKKYLIFFRKDKEGKKGSRFSSTENPTLSSKKKAISPHELHYARKKAEAHDLKKKTFLPYKHAILGKYSGFTT